MSARFVAIGWTKFVRAGRSDLLPSHPLGKHMPLGCPSPPSAVPGYRVQIFPAALANGLFFSPTPQGSPPSALPLAETLCVLATLPVLAREKLALV